MGNATQVTRSANMAVDSISVSVFVVILVEVDKSETSRLVYMAAPNPRSNLHPGPTASVQALAHLHLKIFWTDRRVDIVFNKENRITSIGKYF